MVDWLPDDCGDLLRSKGRINAAGDVFRSGSIDYAEELCAERIIQCYRLFRIGYLSRNIQNISNALAGNPVLLSARLKRLNSLKRKLRRLDKIKLSRVADILGFRIICENVSSAKITIDMLKNLPYPAKIKSHNPAPTGYRATHIELKVPHDFPSGELVTFDIEIQIRTFYQHVWAMQSEAFGEQVKEGGGPPDKRAYLSCLSQAIQDWEEGHKPSEKQQSFPLLAMNSSVIVARLPEIGGAPLVERFEVGDYIALERLVTWENEPESYRSQPLFLAYSGDVNTLQTTHSVYMQGLETGVPLAKWMPRYTPV